MNTKIAPFLLFLAAGIAAWSQDLSLSFMSQTDAKFFVYINGKLQNDTSSGLVTISHLDDKNYHVRIVMDDPFLVATTATLRPSTTKDEYTVNFNAVRERVYVRPVKKKHSENEEELIFEQKADTSSSSATVITAKTTKKRHTEPEPTGTTGTTIRTVKTTVVVDN